jgi:hypothetical protein
LMPIRAIICSAIWVAVGWLKCFGCRHGNCEVEWGGEGRDATA